MALAETPKPSGEVLAGAEYATPLNWTSDTLVWKTGTIDDIVPDGIIISDARYQFSRFGTSFRDINGKILSLGNFGQGTDVTIVLDKDRKTIVTLIKGKAVEDEEE